MSSLETRKIEPATGTTVTLGEAGDIVTMPAGVTLKTNTVKDAGGNTLFTSDGTGTLSSFNSGFDGSMIFISSQTGSGTQYINFTSGIDSTYTEYVFYFVNIHPAAAGYDFQFQLSIDGGSNYNRTMSTTTFRAYHEEDDGGAALQYETGWDQAATAYYQNIGPQILADDDASCSGVLHLFNPAGTTYVKQFWCNMNVMANNPDTAGTCTTAFTAGFVNTTSAINAASFRMNHSSATIDAGTIAMYGIT